MVFKNTGKNGLNVVIGRDVRVIPSYIFYNVNDTPFLLPSSHQSTSCVRIMKQIHMILCNNAVKGFFFI